MTTRDRHKRRQRAAGGPGGIWILVAILSSILLVFYLWGKVQVDIVLQDTDRLESEKKAILREIDGLKIEIEAMKSSQKISAMAMRQGMVYLSSASVEELEVDLDGVRMQAEIRKNDLTLAGMEWWPFRLRHAPERRISGERP
ncbi:hypothetical protein JW906_01740 [bacterium]|nr:hypothetical protein [bacterium]